MSYAYATSGLAKAIKANDIQRCAHSGRLKKVLLK
jgi:hypothetical protein